MTTWHGASWILRETAHHHLESWTDFRLPLSPRSDAHAYQQALRLALAGLSSSNADCLRAAYFGPVALRLPFDLENVLFYNVGEGAFSRLASRGLQCELLLDAPPSPDGAARRHYTSYELTDTLALESWISVRSDEVRIDGISCDLHADPHPWIVWRQIQEALDARPPWRPVQSSDSFAVRISVHCPHAHRVNLAGRIKAFLDGMVATCHTAPGLLEARLLANVARQVDRPEEMCERWLRRSGPFVVSHRCPVESTMSGVRWNPDDHLLVAASLERLVSYDDAADTMDVAFYSPSRPPIDVPEQS